MVRVEGYYCDGSYCAMPARESLEIWIMPATFRDIADVPALQAWRTPQRVGSASGVKVFALASRDWGDGSEFDRSYNGSSREYPSVASQDDDLPLSWNTWQQDIQKALVDC